MDFKLAAFAYKTPRKTQTKAKSQKKSKTFQFVCIFPYKKVFKKLFVAKKALSETSKILRLEKNLGCLRFKY